MTEFPLLEWSDEENRFLAMHHPFTNVMEEDIPLMDTDPGAVRAKAYDLVMNGVEMGSGSIRIHQSDVQEKMFKLLGFTKEQAWDQFGFCLLYTSTSLLSRVPHTCSQTGCQCSGSVAM